MSGGHRQAGHCRPVGRGWTRWWGSPGQAEEMDGVLHGDRLQGRGAHQQHRTYQEGMGRLPDGTFIAFKGTAWLVWHESLLAWSAAGYGARRMLPSTGCVEV